MAEKRNGKVILCDSEKCVGCTACANICPTKSISMKEDMYAEVHPFIAEETCTNCGLCRKVCPQLNEIKYNNPMECYAAWKSNDADRRNSSSGGIAVLLAESVIEQGGVYYGVEFHRNAGVYFTRIDQSDDIRKTQGSKYVQANLGTTFQDIGYDLSRKKPVLFIGSPCQVAGLQLFITNSKYNHYKEKLLTVDFLCHGTVPQKYFTEYLTYLEEKHAYSIDECIFRSNRPERNYHLTLMEKNEIQYCKKAEWDKYFYCFLKSITCRESCMECKFKTQGRVGDITIGDFIGLGSDIPFDFVRGVNPSLVLVNTVIGKEQLDKIKNKDVFIKRTIDEAVKGGPSLKSEHLSSTLRTHFRKRYIKGNFVTATAGFEPMMLIAEYTSYIKKLYNRGKSKVWKITRRCKQ